MSGSAFAITHHAFSSRAGRTSDGNGSHASTLKSPSYTKSVSWQHYPIFINGIKADEADIPADKLMALPSSETYGEIDGVLGNDPAYGMPVT